MKRIAILFLVLVLLLAACTQVTKPEPAGSTALTEAARTEAPTEQPTGSHPTEPPVTEAPETEPPTEPDEGPGLSEGSRTSGGVLVWTDPSAYQPYDGAGAKYTRLREGPLDRFEPSEDYGAVYPYIAAQTELTPEYESWGGYENYYTYGIVDRTGRILTDGIYRSVTALRGSYDEVDTPNGFWSVCRMVGSETRTWEYEGETFTYVSRDYRYGLISMDGSRMLECQYAGIRDLGCGILCQNSEERPDFTVLSYDLEPILTGDQFFDDPENEDWSLTYNEGMLRTETWTEVKRWDEEDEITYTDFQYVNWFFDEDGNRICGPYAAAADFSEGLACVSTDGEHFGYIDKTGAWVIEPIYLSFYSFENGQAVQRTAEGRNVVIDRSGSERFQLAVGGAYPWENGYVVVNSSAWDNYRYTYYDFDGTELFSGEQIEWLEGRVFCGRKGSNQLCFATPERELITVKTMDRNPVRGAAMQDGELLMGWYVGWNSDEQSWLFVPSDYSEVIVIPETARPTANTWRPYEKTADRVTWETWYFFWTGRVWEGRTEEGDRITVPLRSACPAPMGGLVSACTDSASWLLNPEGETVFCYPYDTGD